MKINALCLSILIIGIASSACLAQTTPEAAPIFAGSIVKRQTQADKDTLQELGMLLTKGQSLTYSGSVDDALKFWLPIYQQGNISPSSSRAYSHSLFAASVENLGNIASRQGNYAEALRYYDQSYSPESLARGAINDRGFRVKYALLLQKAGRYDEAWEHYQYAMNVEQGWRLPKPPGITREQVPTAQFVFAANLVVAATKLDFDDAQGVAFARDAAKANPSSGLPHYYLGQLLQRNDPAGAKVEYEKAVLYGRGEYVEDAKRALLYVKSRLAKPVTPASAAPK